MKKFKLPPNANASVRAVRTANIFRLFLHPLQMRRITCLALYFTTESRKINAERPIVLGDQSFAMVNNENVSYCLNTTRVNCDVFFLSTKISFVLSCSNLHEYFENVLQCTERILVCRYLALKEIPTKESYIWRKNFRPVFNIL